MFTVKIHNSRYIWKDMGFNKRYALKQDMEDWETYGLLP